LKKLLPNLSLIFLKKDTFRSDKGTKSDCILSGIFLLRWLNRSSHCNDDIPAQCRWSVMRDACEQYNLTREFLYVSVTIVCISNDCQCPINGVEVSSDQWHAAIHILAHLNAI
jgi:hypothetical protein